MESLQYLSWQTMVLRLLMAAAAGAIVGLERERSAQSAGFRTHLLVSAGAAIFTMASLVMAGEEYDRARIAAQVVTGIGFLGAGTIIRHGASVHGLTTAASIWSVAAVGMAAGMGWWQAVVAATVLLYVSLTLLKLIEEKVLKTRKSVSLTVEMEGFRMSLAKLREELTALGHEPNAILTASHDDAQAMTATIVLDDISPGDATDVMDHVARLAGVTSVRCE